MQCMSIDGKSWIGVCLKLAPRWWGPSCLVWRLFHHVWEVRLVSGKTARVHLDHIREYCINVGVVCQKTRKIKTPLTRGWKIGIMEDDRCNSNHNAEEHEH